MRKSGFTLIELLVVIAIIGLLGSLVIISIKAAREKAIEARLKHNVDQIQTALEAYYQGEGEGKYPWDTARGKLPWHTVKGSSPWESYKDTPCWYQTKDKSTIITINNCDGGPKTCCTDSTLDISEPEKFLEQLVEAGYFTRSQVKQMIAQAKGSQPGITIAWYVYVYTCDLQQYAIQINLPYTEEWYGLGNLDINKECPKPKPK